MTWISVKDRLPDHNTPVLFYGRITKIFPSKTQHVGICNRAGGLNDWLTLGHKMHEVSHWMPLPEPPKE